MIRRAFGKRALLDLGPGRKGDEGLAVDAAADFPALQLGAEQAEIDIDQIAGRP